MLVLPLKFVLEIAPMSVLVQQEDMEITIIIGPPMEQQQRVFGFILPLVLFIK